MGLINKMAESIRAGLQNFLQISPAPIQGITIQEKLNFQTNAIKNKIWYRGESVELSQLYEQLNLDNTLFWSAVPTNGLAIRKIHTGLPSLIVKTLTSIVMTDLNAIEVDDSKKDDWENILIENDFIALCSEAVTQALVVGDGAFKISFDTDISKLPIIEFVSGENIEINKERGRIKEIIFKCEYCYNKTRFLLYEAYGYGYVKYKLYRGTSEVPLSTIPQTANLQDVQFDKSFCMAVPFMFYKSDKYSGRGRSVFDGRTDNFDAFDEVFSQWMDALRRGRAKEYIPDSLLPRNPNNGEVLKPNAFDHSYIKTDSIMSEGQSNKIEVIQPNIPHESYLSTYITALDLCLQGLISPSTLGIDTKKLDNADAQREKEKATLYTRNAIVSALQNIIPKVVDVVFKSYNTFLEQALEDITCTVEFGEYANPSFESQVETVGKGKTQGIMSIEACVDELYGDTKDDDWKAEEVARLKAEQGIASVDEGAVNDDLGGAV